MKRSGIEASLLKIQSGKPSPLPGGVAEVSDMGPREKVVRSPLLGRANQVVVAAVRMKRWAVWMGVDEHLKPHMWATPPLGVLLGDPKH